MPALNWPPRVAHKRTSNAALYNQPGPQPNQPDPQPAPSTPPRLPAIAEDDEDDDDNLNMTPKTKASFKKTRAAIKAAAKDMDGGVAAFLAKMAEESSQDLDTRNPLTRTHHDRAKRSWEGFVCCLERELRDDINARWSGETVRKYATLYLKTRVETTTGRNGGLCKAVTVASWATHLIYCIARFTFDEKTGQPCGQKLLRDGLYKELEDLLLHLIHTKKLDRHSDAKKKRYGENEFQLVAEHAIESSELRGREVKLQSMAALFVGFASGVRPSGLAAAHVQFVEEDKYMKLGDFQIYRREHGVWDVHVDFQHHKGWNTSITGFSQTHVYRALKHVHNLMYDPVWIVAYMFVRKAFKYETLDELIDSEDHELEIIKQDEPFFIKAIEGGLHLVSPVVPATASNVSMAVAQLLRSAGLEGSMYAFRRGTANEMDVRLGAQKASLMLGHTDANSVLTKHYSLGAGNFDILAIRLGEATEQLQPGVEASLRLHQRLGAAVALVASRFAIGRRELAPEKDANQLKKSQTSQLDQEIISAKSEARGSSEAVRKLLEDISKDWAKFVQLLKNTKSYERAAKMKEKQQNIDLIKALDDFQKLLASAEFKSQATKIEEDLRAKFRLLVDTNRTINRRAADRVRNAAKAQKIADSSNDRDKAVAHFQEQSELLNTAISLKPVDLQPVEELSREQLEEELATMGAEEDDLEEEEMIAESLGVLNHKLHSLCGKGSDTAVKSMLEPLEADPQPVDENQLFLDEAPLEPYSDENEQALIPDVPTPEARCLLLRHLLAPITSAQEFERQVEADNGKVLCQRCKLIPDTPEHDFKLRNTLEKHMKNHTEWNDLVLRMKWVDGRYLCPASSCGQRMTTVKNVRSHCLKHCPEKQGFQLMKKQHDDFYKSRYHEESDNEEPSEEQKDQAAVELKSVTRESLMNDGALYGYSLRQMEQVVGTMVHVAHVTGQVRLNSRASM